MSGTSKKGPLAMTTDRVSDDRLRELLTWLGDDTFAGFKRTCNLPVAEAKALVSELLALRACGGEGWVMVPREPTMAMMAAGADRVDDSMAHANAVYRAMLASLPTQESEDGR